MQAAELQTCLLNLYTPDPSILRQFLLNNQSTIVENYELRDHPLSRTWQMRVIVPDKYT